MQLTAITNMDIKAGKSYIYTKTGIFLFNPKGYDNFSTALSVANRQNAELIDRFDGYTVKTVDNVESFKNSIEYKLMMAHN